MSTQDHTSSETQADSPTDSPTDTLADIPTDAAAAIDALQALGDPEKATGMARYHKVERIYLGVANPVLDALTRDWRRALDLPARLALADGLWSSDVYEGRVAAAKLLTQARIRPDDTEVWRMIVSWVPQFDSWAIADHACIAGRKRLEAVPARLDEVEQWTTAEDMWTRRTALVMTLPWTRQNTPKPADLAIRERVLGWAAVYCDAPEWFIQKAIGWWLRDLSRHDPERTLTFLAEHGARMKPFARREAATHLPDYVFVAQDAADMAADQTSDDTAEHEDAAAPPPDPTE